MSSSPRAGKYRSESSDSDSTGARPSRIGLSDYTSQRLAELRARRADTDYHDYKYRKEARDGAASSPSVSGSSSTADSVDSYRSRRMAGTGSDATTTTTSSTRTTTTSARDHKDYTVDSSSRSPELKLTSLSSAAERRNSKTDDEDECVGFSSLPEQVHRKAVKRGFDFTLLVVGESGLGKSTLVSSLFLNNELYKDRVVPAVEERISKTVNIQKKYMEIEEKGVRLRLTIVDTPGFNDSVSSEQSWKPVEDYINQQFDQYFNDESGLNRKHIKDNRVHCCLYFVSPFGHGLRQIDVLFMKRLHDKVNIVPVIAKADTLTKTEIKNLKSKVLQQISDEGIRIYEFPDCDSDEDEEFKKQDEELKASIPFAVIGSNTIVEINGKKVRGRLYPWGIVEVDNPDHCDFVKLRQMLISTHMQDLKDVTRDVHYENYRAKHIREQMTNQQKERSKLKRDSSPNFEGIMDADSLLQQKDEEIRRMQMMLVKMQAKLTSTSPASPPQVNGQVNGLKNL